MLLGIIIATVAMIASCDVPLVGDAVATPQREMLLAKRPTLDSNTSCKACHAEAFAAWRASRHAKAGRNPAFNFEYGSHPGTWCMGCHAPRSKRDLKLATARRQGVDCITCHVKDGQLHSRTRAASSPHKTATDASFGGPSMCAGCHQFNFPVLSAKGDLVRYTDQPMQNTFGEYRASGTTAECIDCHMAKGSHRFEGAYVPSKVQEALNVSLCGDATAYQVSIANALSAHNVPSGGVNRAIVLTLYRTDNPQGRQQYRMERLYDGPVGERRKRKDTTLVPGGRATWTIPRTLLGLGTPKELVLAGDFYFGTDPNPKAPKARVEIFETAFDAASLKDCDE